jgi:uroporphyrinogen decarboxylase
MAEMTSRERVLAALNHEEPDRVPLDIGGGSSTSILVEGYENLKRYLQVGGETKVLNKVAHLARLDERVMQRLGSDCRPLSAKPPANWTPPPSKPGTLIDRWGIVRRQVYYGDGRYYWELAHSPLAEASVEGLESYPWPDTSDPGYTAGLAEEARALYEETDFAIVADGGFKSFWELGYLMRGHEQLLMDTALNPEFVKALMQKLLEINIKMTGRFLDAVGPYIQVIRAGDDLATQKGPFFSHQTYRTLIKPAHKAFFDFVKSKTEAKIFYHSCGNVTEFIDDLAEIGVDILNPVQVSAIGDTAALKARFGNKVVFWGGIDTQRVLPQGSAEDVEAEVRRRIRDLGPGGGYVVASVHNIQPDVPPENIVAMAEATRKFGRYPLAVW